MKLNHIIPISDFHKILSQLPQKSFPDSLTRISDLLTIQPTLSTSSSAVVTL